MVPRIQSADQFEFVVWESFEALNLALFNDEELYSMVSFLEDEVILVSNDELESVHQLKLLRLVQTVKKLDLVDKAGMFGPLLHA